MLRMNGSISWSQHEHVTINIEGLYPSKEEKTLLFVIYYEQKVGSK